MNYWAMFHRVRLDTVFKNVSVSIRDIECYHQSLATLYKRCDHILLQFDAAVLQIYCNNCRKATGFPKGRSKTRLRAQSATILVTWTVWKCFLS